jgi:hypothetical protein
MEIAGRRTVNRLFVAGTIALFLIALAPQMNAQLDRDLYHPREVSALVDRVHDDLNRAYGVWHASGGDRDRLNHAEKQLRDFAQKMEQGEIDKGELDEAIAGVQHVLDNNRLPDRERDALSSDVAQLRGMREAYNRHEIR